MPEAGSGMESADVNYRREPIAKRSFAIPTELVGCVRSEAGRVFGASGMRRCSNDAPRIRLAAPHADCEVEGADVNLGFARGSRDHQSRRELLYR
jgi:hypothetical protein